MYDDHKKIGSKLDSSQSSFHAFCLRGQIIVPDDGDDGDDDLMTICPIVISARITSY